jgi:hypothetical protein
MPAAARPQETVIRVLEDCHIDGINRHDRSMALRHGDELDVARRIHSSVLLWTEAATASLGATTLPSADAMRYSTFDAEIGIS